MESISVIEARGLYKKFMLHSNYSKKKILVLDNLNLEIEKGELFCIVGPNGAGKTTLLRILSGLILPSRGDIYIKGYSLVNGSRIIRSLVGLVIGEERSFYWRLTARTNLEFFARLYGLIGKELKERINAVADLLEIESQLDRRFQECSSGNKQRLAMAKALLHNPEDILMDEPTKHLDPVASEKLMNFIKKRINFKTSKDCHLCNSGPKPSIFSESDSLLEQRQDNSSGEYGGIETEYWENRSRYEGNLFQLDLGRRVKDRIKGDRLTN